MDRKEDIQPGGRKGKAGEEKDRKRRHLMYCRGLCSLLRSVCLSFPCISLY